MNILLTSVGRRSYLVEYFKEALKGAGQVIACNSSKDSTALMVADLWMESPLIYSPEYVPFLLDVVRKHEVRLVISLFDADLPVLARRQQELEEAGALVLVSSSKVIEVCNNKWATYELLSGNEVAVPATFLKLDDAVAAIEREALSYPVVVKPRWGMGSMSIFVADTEEELRVFYAKSKRQVFESYLKYESKAAAEACVIIQEHISGDEYGLDVVNDLHGRHLTTSVKRKIAMRSGETDGAVTLDMPELQDLGRRIAGMVGHVGNLDVDVLERGGRYFVLELNARFGGGYPFSHMAGMNLPAEILRWCRGEDADADRLKVRPGVVGFKAVDPRLSTIHHDSNLQSGCTENGNEYREAGGPWW